MYYSKDEEARLMTAAKLALWHDTWDLETVNGTYLEVSHAQIKEAIPQLGFDADGEHIGDLVDIHFHTGDIVTISLTTNYDSALHIYDWFQPNKT